MLFYMATSTTSKKGIGKMTKSDIASLVDKGAALKLKMDKLETELSEINKKLKAEAKKKKAKELAGSKFTAKFSPHTWTDCEPRDVYDVCPSMDQFFGLVKVKISDAKKSLGETLFGSVSSQQSIPFHKISYRKNK